MTEAEPLQEQAMANGIENFGHPYNKALTDIFSRQHSNNEVLVRKMVQNDEILEGVKRLLMSVTYEAPSKTVL